MKVKLLSFFPVGIICLLSFFIARPFFQKGYFETQDGGWAVVRLAEMEREVKDLQFPPRYSGFLNHGYGYPLFNFTYPFPYYLGTVLRAFHIGYIDSIKVLFVLSILLSGIGMYILGKYLTNIWGGIISSTFYLGSFYRVLNLYTRGSLGESLASAVFPFLILCSLLYTHKGNKAYLLLASSLLFILLITHNVSALFFIPILLVFLFTQKHTLRSFQVLFFGFGLASFFIIPAFLEKNLINFVIRSQAGVSDALYSFIDLTIHNGRLSQNTIQIGLFPMIAVFLSYIYFKIRQLRLKKQTASFYEKSYLFILLSLVVYIFMMTPLSVKLWDLPLLSSVDFPWRLLGPVTFLISILTLSLSQGNIGRIFGMTFAIISFVYVIPFTKAIVNPNLTDSLFLTNDATTTSADELMPKWVIDKPKDRYNNKIEFIQGTGGIQDLVYNSKMLKAFISSQSNSKIMINTIYYPGWSIRLNNKVVDSYIDRQKGTMIVDLNSGLNYLELSFGETPYRIFSDLISLIAGVSLCFIALKSYKKI